MHAGLIRREQTSLCGEDCQWVVSFRQLVVKPESLRVRVDTAVGMLVLSDHDQRHYIVEPAANIAKDPHGSATYDVAIGVRGVTPSQG